MKPVLNLKETAQLLGISMPTVYQLARRDDFPAIRISARRIVVPLHRWRRGLKSRRNTMNDKRKRPPLCWNTGAAQKMDVLCIVVHLHFIRVTQRGQL